MYRHIEKLKLLIMGDHLTINLRVADMRYPLRVKRSEEEIYRKAAVEIDYKLDQYKKKFTGDSLRPLTNVDFMAMTAIQSVSEKVEYQMRTELFETKLKDLTLELESYLSSL